MNNTVFVNCPFDCEYEEIRRSIVFTLLMLGFEPIFATFDNDCSNVRLPRIISCLKGVKYSIHDISMCKVSQDDFSNAEAAIYCRMNMPFELGIDFGMKSCSEEYPAFSQKQLLILEKDRYDYQKALSDLNGVDPSNHNNNPMEVISIVRDWFVNKPECKVKTGPSRIWQKYIFFCDHLDETKQTQGFSQQDIRNLRIEEVMQDMTSWLAG